MKSILLFSSSLNAGPNCPQREPSTVISFITIGAKLSSLPEATVLLRTRIPLGFVNAIDVSNPETNVKNLNKEEILILLGKGHEKYEIDQNGRREFDEKIIAVEAYKKYYLVLFDY